MCQKPNRGEGMKNEHKLTQSITATGIIRTKGQAAAFFPDCPSDGIGHALLGIKIRPETLKRLQNERVAIVIYPAVEPKK